MKRLTAFAMIITFLFSGTLLFAQESEAGHSHEKAEAHGGTVVMTQQHHFEVVPMMHGLAVFAYDYHQNPVDASGASGSVTILTKSGKKYTAKLQPYSGGMGMMSQGASGMHSSGMQANVPYMNSMLYANIDLANIDVQKAKADVSISGLSSSKEPQVSFRETVSLANLPQNLTQMMDMAEAHHHGEDHAH